MRLYVDTNDIPILKDALLDAIVQAIQPKVLDRLCVLFERVELCEQLQNNMKRSRENQNDAS